MHCYRVKLIAKRLNYTTRHTCITCLKCYKKELLDIHEHAVDSLTKDI